MASSDAVKDLWWVVGILAVLGLVWFFGGGVNNPDAHSGPFISPPAPLDNGVSYDWSATTTRQNNSGGYFADHSAADFAGNPNSASQFTIDTGNARYEIQPNQEYVALNYHGQTPVDITGWYLTNGKNDRPYDAGGGNVGRLKSDVVVIPRVTRLFIGGGANTADSNVVLTTGAQVVIVTGNPPANNDPFTLNASFQTNLCTGYIGNLPNRQFTPALSGNCPAPRDWPGVTGVANECYRYVNNLGTCRTPKLERQTDGYDYLDGQKNPLTSTCLNFVLASYNYNGCVAQFKNQPDFYQNSWRIYLNRPWELWASERETITLSDKNNKVIVQTKY